MLILQFNLRALMGILDDYFEGYYSEEMIESQVIIMSFIDSTVNKFNKR